MSKQDDETKETMVRGERTVEQARKAVHSARRLLEMLRKQPDAPDPRQLALAATHLEEAELHVVVAQRGGLEKL